MPATEGTNTGLVFGWEEGEDDWGIPMNENLIMLDAIIQGAVKSKSLATPPVSPTVGDRYIIPVGATGVWAPNVGKVALYSDYGGNQWVYFTPKSGWRFWVESELLFVRYDSGTSTWVPETAGSVGGGLVGFNTVSDMNAAAGSYPNATVAAVFADPDVTNNYPRVAWRKNGAGPGTWVKGSDVLLPVFALAAPQWVVFDLGMLMHVDQGGMYSGNFNKLYIPRVITIYRYGMIRDAVTAVNALTTAAGFNTTHCELNYDNMHDYIVYFDTGDNTFKCIVKSGWAAANFPGQADEIFPIMHINGGQIEATQRYMVSFDPTRPVYVPNFPIIADSTTGKILASYGRIFRSTSVTDTPWGGAALPDDEYFKRVDIQTSSPATPSAYYIDLVTGLPVAKACPWPSSPNTQDSMIFARSHGGVVHSQYGIVSRAHGNMARNQLQNGDRPFNCPILSADAQEVALDDAALTALGFVYGIRNNNAATASRAVHAGMKLQDPYPGAPVAGRATITIAAGQPWTNVIGRMIFLPFIGAQPVSLPGGALKAYTEEIISARTRVIVWIGKVPDNDFFGNLVAKWHSVYMGAWVNGANTSPLIIPVVSAVQISQNNGAAWIERYDFKVGIGTSDRLDALEALTPDPAIDRILYGDDMYLDDAFGLDLYPERLLDSETAGNGFKISVVSQRSGYGAEPFLPEHEGNSIRLDSRVGPPLLNITARRPSDIQSPVRGEYRYTKEITGHRATVPHTGTIRPHVQGDSLMANDVVNHLKNQLGTAPGLGYTVSMVGTVDNAGGLGEARVGIKTSDFINLTTAKPPIVSVADYNARSSIQNDPTSKWQFNPYLTQDTGGAPVGTVFNGYYFDPAGYLSKFSLATPTHVLFCGGTNDAFAVAYPDSVNNYLTAIDVIYKQWRAVDGAINIGFMIPSPADTSATSSTWAQEYVAMIRGLMAYVRTKRLGGDTKVSVISLWAHMSNNGGFVVTGSSNIQVTQDADTLTKIYQLKDYLHPFTTGRRQIAYILSAWVACTQQGV